MTPYLLVGYIITFTNINCTGVLHKCHLTNLSLDGYRDLFRPWELSWETKNRNIITLYKKSPKYLNTWIGML